MSRSISLIVSTVFVFLALASLTYADDTSRATTIEVTGRSKIMVMPNIATISFTVETNGREARDAISKNAKLAENLLNVLKARMGKDGEIKTSRYTLSPVYEKDRRASPAGYRVANSVTLQQRILIS